MKHETWRRVIGVCASLFACAALSACPDPTPPEKPSTLQQGEPVTMVVQLTGLLLLVPTSQATGGMNVLMPKMQGHRALIGFLHSEETFCTPHYRGICYVDLDKWSVSPLGAASTGSPKVPEGAFNLTVGSGGAKVDTTNAQVKDSLRAQVALLSGSATDSCGLSAWSFDPVGNPAPRTVNAINVMEWQIPDVPQTVELVLRPRAGGSARHAILRPNDANEIEVLIVHVTDYEAGILTGTRRLNDPAFSAGADNDSGEKNQDDLRVSHSQTVRKHFQAFYGLVTQDRTKWRQPARPRIREEICPITILGLEDHFGVNREEAFGTKTLSCVMASAEGI